MSVDLLTQFIRRKHTK